MKNKNRTTPYYTGHQQNCPQKQQPKLKDILAFILYDTITKIDKNQPHALDTLKEIDIDIMDFLRPYRQEQTSYVIGYVTGLEYCRHKYITKPEGKCKCTQKKTHSKT